MHLPPRQLDLFKAPTRRPLLVQEAPAALAEAPAAKIAAQPPAGAAPQSRQGRPTPMPSPAAAGIPNAAPEGGRPPPRESAPARVTPSRTPPAPDLGAAPPEAERPEELRRASPPPSRQQALSAARVLAQQLATLLGPEVKVLLSVHDNRSTMISFRREPPLLRLRVHHLFLDAPAEVVAAIAEYAGRGRRTAGRVLDAYIADRQERIRAEARRATALSARGQCFDLAEVFERLNRLYFQDSIRARIGWGRNSNRRRRKSIRLGVYDHRSREIRIHPALDRPDVPLFFVEYIVFHEMLHQVFPSARDSGRHVHHPRAFRDRERAFPRYAAAIAWEKAHLHALLKR